MGVLGLVIGAGIAGLAIKKARKNAREAEKRRREAAEIVAEQERRRNTPCQFVDGFTEIEFRQMVLNAGNSIKRIKRITMDGPFVFGVVHSQSGISEWEFKLDVNDYGHITGKYWLSSDNEDSNIPNRLGDLICQAIKNHLQEDDKKHPVRILGKYGYCPYCGNQLIVNNAHFCTFCGTKLRD